MRAKSKPHRLLRWLNLLLILVTLLAYLAPYVSPATFWPFAFVGLLYPWLLLGNLLCILCWLFFKQRYFLFSLACILLGWGHFQSYVGLHLRSGPYPEDSIRAMTFNSYGFRHEGKSGVRFTTEELPGSFPLEGIINLLNRISHLNDCQVKFTISPRAFACLMPVDRVEGR